MSNGKTTIYIYTMPMCRACTMLKQKHKDAHIDFTERAGSRLFNDHRIFDDIDKEAFMVLQMQNQTFPVLLEVGSA